MALIEFPENIVHPYGLSFGEIHPKDISQLDSDDIIYVRTYRFSAIHRDWGEHRILLVQTKSHVLKQQEAGVKSHDLSSLQVDLSAWGSIGAVLSKDDRFGLIELDSGPDREKFAAGYNADCIVGFKFWQEGCLSIKMSARSDLDVGFDIYSKSMTSEQLFSYVVWNRGLGGKQRRQLADLRLPRNTAPRDSFAADI